MVPSGATHRTRSRYTRVSRFSRECSCEARVLTKTPRLDATREVKDVTMRELARVGCGQYFFWNTCPTRLVGKFILQHTRSSTRRRVRNASPSGHRLAMTPMRCVRVLVGAACQAICRYCGGAKTVSFCAVVSWVGRERSTSESVCELSHRPANTDRDCRTVRSGESRKVYCHYRM